ncbi:MAG TPA: hypothetical protein VGC55_02155 [Dokdonella sp.]
MITPRSTPDAQRAVRATAPWWTARTARNALLALLMLLLLLRVPFAAMHTGLARDFFVAYRIVHGDEWPLHGPILNDTIHLGPIWFYLFAGLLALGRGWLATLLLLGSMAALQIPLAYQLGKALHSRRAGVLFALGLIVPNWASFEWLLPSHPQLSAACDLAVLLCAVRYWQRPRTKYFVGMLGMFALAVHAHPANAGLVWIILALTVWAWRAHVLKWRDVVAGGALALLPLLPFFYWDAVHGFADLRGATSYLGNAKATGSMLNLPSVFAGIAWGGTRDWFEPMLGWPSRWADLATVVVAGGGIAGAIGLLSACRDPHRRSVVAICVLATLAVLLTTAAIRVDTPYYMVSSGWTLLAGLVGYGLASLGESSAARITRTGAGLVAVLACVVALQGTARFQLRGAWPFAWHPLFDIKSAPDTNIELMPTMPAYAQARSGNFLCGEQALSVHGTYAAQLILDHAIAMRLACHRADVHIGGGERDRRHWLGLSRSMLAQIGLAATRHVGPLGLLRARAVGDLPGVLPPDEPIYPPLPPPPAAAAGEHPLRFTLGAAEHLAITTLVSGLAARPELSVTIGGQPASPRARDSFSAVYACDACAAGTTSDVVVEVRNASYSAVDVVVF